MAVLVEIVGAVSGEETAEAYVAAFCQQVGGLLIGRRVNEQTHQAQFLIRFLHPLSMSEHTEDLSRACQQHLIESFRYVSGGLVQISFHPSLNLREQMQDFPLRPDESWFPDIHNPHQAYICMSRPVMLAKQAAWLLARDAAWSFV
jgi:hypothetical protein